MKNSEDLLPILPTSKLLMLPSIQYAGRDWFDNNFQNTIDLKSKKYFELLPMMQTMRGIIVVDQYYHFRLGYDYQTYRLTFEIQEEYNYIRLIM